MNKFTHYFILLLFIALPLVMMGCNEEFDEYYARPTSLAGPVYQVLSDSARFRGNFDHYLALVEKAGYRETLSSAGYWTVFAPNDDAFEQYFRDKGYSGIADIDADKAFEIVAYSLVLNAYKLETLPYYQTGPGNDTSSVAFRRKTAYYKGATPTNVYGQQMEVVATNRNGIGTFAINDNNNKYMPYFLNHYLNKKEITPSDIEVFYDRPYAGPQIDKARVVISNVNAENGIIHVIDRVIEPLPNISDYLFANEQYSLFNSILEMSYRPRNNNIAVNFDAESYPQLTERYGALRNLAGPVHVKSYTGAYAFAPNNENHLRANRNDAQTESWTLFAPRNEALQQFLDNILLVNYGVLSNVPDEIIFDLVNMHMFQTTVWPSAFNLNNNILGETARFDKDVDIFDRKVLSNGLFYGTNKVQQGNFFFSVYGQPYLDPQYSIMRILLNAYRITISSPDQFYGLIMMSNQQIIDAGFEYNPGTPNPWTYNGVAAQAYDRILRMLELSIIQLDSPDELNNLTEPKIFESIGGEYVRIENNQIFSSGNIDTGKILDIDVSMTRRANNGQVLYTNGLLDYTQKTLSQIIFENAQFTKFGNYLRSSSIYNAQTLQIEGVGVGAFFTVLAPSDEAIDAAIAEGKLPANPNTNNAEERDAIASFLRYHFIPRNVIVPDGKKIVNPNGEDFNTLLATLAGEIRRVKIDNSALGFTPPFTMTVTDRTGRVANVVKPNSNVLAGRAVIHQLDKVLYHN